MNINLPEEFAIKMKRLLKDEYDEYIKSFNSKSYVGLRVNTLKTSIDFLKNKLEFIKEEVPWCKEGFYYDEYARPAKHPYYYAGLYYIQEPSAMCTGAYLEIKEGDHVLDMCAAPGGKSTQAAAKLNKKGILISNDISSGRCKALLKNIELAGIPNAIITNESPKNLSAKFKAYFNKIIVDAPCSGEGMFRKDSEAIKSWRKHKSDMCRVLQREILDEAAKLLCDGGIIAYSTCTFEPSENEGTISEFLKRHENFELVRFDKYTLFDDGHTEWAENGEEDLKYCARLWPHKIKGEGHFLALLRRKCGNEYIEPKKISPANENKLFEFREFCKNFTHLEYTLNLNIFKNSLMQVPEGLDLTGIRTVRSGLYMGEFKTKRFEPSQALAMAISRNEAKNIVDMNIEDERVKRYLKGESFRAEGKEGWNLVCVDSFPLGWGKLQKGRLKNKYLTGWKMN